MTLEQALKDKETVIIDVRTYDEFEGGNVAGSINIPLGDIPSKLDQLKTMKTIVLCCASGNRSRMAHNYLDNQDIETIDGGGWLNVNNIKNNLDGE
jgi:rhodanese-related sulfurtransferase